MNPDNANETCNVNLEAFTVNAEDLELDENRIHIIKTQAEWDYFNDLIDIAESILRRSSYGVLADKLKKLKVNINHTYSLSWKVEE